MPLRPLLLVQLLFALAATAHDGVLAGKVSAAASGQPVPDVVVTATSPALHGELVAISDAGGRFEIPQAPAGRYTLVFEHEGFEPFTHWGLELGEGRTLHLSSALSAHGAQRDSPSVLVTDLSSTELSMGLDFVRHRGVLVGRPAPTPAVRPFESLAHLAPRSSGVLHAVSINGDATLDCFVIDGVAELAPEWTHDYPPMVTPSGESQWLQVYPEELP